MKRPVCYTTGLCMKPSETDCPIKARVDANFWAGRPSTEWGTQLLRQTKTIGGPADGFKITEHVDAIQSTDGTPKECNLRHDDLVAALLKPSPAPFSLSSGVVTYTIEGVLSMTQPALPMTVEAAEIALTRELGFRLVGTTLESVDFAEEDVAVVKDTGPADWPTRQLWSAAVRTYVSLGNAEQRELEMMVKIKTIADELDTLPASLVADQAADQLRALLPADGK
jgi:hypothetical protein